MLILIFGNVTVGYAKFKNILTILVSDTTSKNFNKVMVYSRQQQTKGCVISKAQHCLRGLNT